jgi:hypothetical protein
LYFTFFISHFYISYSNVNEISYFKGIANCISKNAFWIAAWIWIYKEDESCLWFNYILIILYNKGCVWMKTCIHFINYALLFYVVSSWHIFQLISSHQQGDQLQGMYLCISVESRCRALHCTFSVCGKYSILDSAVSYMLYIRHTCVSLSETCWRWYDLTMYILPHKIIWLALNKQVSIFKLSLHWKVLAF